ncbi:hypothetical protein QM180_10125 [Acinetobacter nosocomialis]|uniref:hypothetical protein n=1 Tax=Acinetobacter nosocomialis TaxID=106654 RepID=UPI001F447DD4|nr:hypothetical protein [Acinetobacter nosocomialis]MCF1272758.1 hypothetical protein [Acinetobacter nosocomialis]MDV5587527.1 hypothetical protein [Acinetobacter nosocomialis]
MQRTPKYLEPMPNWTETERPALIGSPASIEHPNHLRVAYLFIGVFIALSASLGNGLIISNALLFQGEFSLTPSERLLSKIRTYYFNQIHLAYFQMLLVQLMTKSVFVKYAKF